MQFQRAKLDRLCGLLVAAGILQENIADGLTVSDQQVNNTQQQQQPPPPQQQQQQQHKATSVTDSALVAEIAHIKSLASDAKNEASRAEYAAAETKRTAENLSILLFEVDQRSASTMSRCCGLEEHKGEHMARINENRTLALQISARLKRLVAETASISGEVPHNEGVSCRKQEGGQSSETTTAPSSDVTLGTCTSDFFPLEVTDRESPSPGHHRGGILGTEEEPTTSERTKLTSLGNLLTQGKGSGTRVVAKCKEKEARTDVDAETIISGAPLRNYMGFDHKKNTNPGDIRLLDARDGDATAELKENGDDGRYPTTESMPLYSPNHAVYTGQQGVVRQPVRPREPRPQSGDATPHARTRTSSPLFLGNTTSERRRPPGKTNEVDSNGDDNCNESRRTLNRLLRDERSKLGTLTRRFTVAAAGYGGYEGRNFCAIRSKESAGTMNVISTPASSVGVSEDENDPFSLHNSRVSAEYSPPCPPSPQSTASYESCPADSARNPGDIGNYARSAENLNTSYSLKHLGSEGCGCPQPRSQSWAVQGFQEPGGGGGLGSGFDVDSIGASERFSTLCCSNPTMTLPRSDAGASGGTSSVGSGGMAVATTITTGKGGARTTPPSFSGRSTLATLEGASRLWHPRETWNSEQPTAVVNSVAAADDQSVITSGSTRSSDNIDTACAILGGESWASICIVAGKLVPSGGVADEATHERPSDEGIPPLGSVEERSTHVAGNAGSGPP